MKVRTQLNNIASYSKGSQINGDELIENGKYDYLNGGVNPSGKWNSFNVPANTVTISEGGNSCGYVNYMQEPFWCGAHCYYLYDSNLSSKYLYYVLKSQQDRLMNSRTGACMPNIKKSDLGKFELVYDNDEQEQKKVVSVLQSVELVISSRKQELQKLDELIKVRFVEMFGNPDVNEFGWDVYKMEQLCDVGSSKRILQSEQTMTGVPFLRIADLVNRIDNATNECNLFIPQERFEELKKQGLVPACGDILLTARGTLGRCYIMRENDEFYFQDGMITWLSNYDERITALYISYLFEIPGFRKQIDALQAGSTVAYLSISMTKKLRVMLPPIELQEQFATFVEQVDKSKAVVQKSLEETQVLFDSLMQKYFG